MTVKPRWERRNLTSSAKPVLVIGALPAGTGALSRLASYCGAEEETLTSLFEFDSVLPTWPDSDDALTPDLARSWEVGQRLSLLRADLLERPRRKVVTLGGWVHSALGYWWYPQETDLFQWSIIAGGGGVVIAHSPDPSNIAMWWDAPANRDAGERFWKQTASFAANALPLPRTKVKLSVRTSWLLGLVDFYGVRQEGWPEECVDWPWVEPPGRPQALMRGNGVPAAHLALDSTVGPRPSRAHQALHSCDRGDHCVNPRHLRWGTELENRLDQSARARGDIGRVGLDLARDVRKQLEKISAETGVPMDAISRIASGKSWAEDSWND